MANGSQNMTTDKARQAFYLQAPHEAGGHTDKYGNLQHNRGADETDTSANEDYWNIKSFNGSAVVRVYWETGNITGIGTNTITLPDGSLGEFHAIRGNVGVWMGIGSGNTNHGLYSDVKGNWMIYADGSGNVQVNGNAATATALTSNAGGAEQPIYFTGGKPAATSYALKATVNNSTANYMAYYDSARSLTGTSYIRLTSQGTLSIFPAGGNYRDGIRIHARTADNEWAAILLCGSDNTGDSGTSANSWFLGATSGNLYFGRNGTGGSGTYLRCVNNVWEWNGTANGSISGNAATATSALTLLTNNTAQGADACYDGNPGLHFYRYNGSSGQAGGDGFIMQWSWNPGSVGQQLYMDDNPSGTLMIRGYNNSNKTFTAWRQLVLGDGTGASGTWGINVTGSSASCTGNAATATTASNISIASGTGGTYYKLIGVPSYAAGKQAVYVSSPAEVNNSTLRCSNIAANAGYLYSTANGVTVQIGGQNSGCCHIYISQNVPFAFNRGFLMVNSGDIGSGSYPTGNIIVKANGRISGNGGALYLGNSGNQSWVYVQDMCSQDGQKWKILQTGTAVFTGTVTTNNIINLSTSTYGDARCQIKISSNRTFGLHLGAGGVNRGLYDWTNDHWFLYYDDNNTSIQAKGGWRVAIQTDGNLVVYNGNTAYWSARYGKHRTDY